MHAPPRRGGSHMSPRAERRKNSQPPVALRALPRPRRSGTLLKPEDTLGPARVPRGWRCCREVPRSGPPQKPDVTLDPPAAAVRPLLSIMVQHGVARLGYPVLSPFTTGRRPLSRSSTAVLAHLDPQDRPSLRPRNCACPERTDRRADETARGRSHADRGAAFHMTLLQRRP